MYHLVCFGSCLRCNADHASYVVLIKYNLTHMTLTLHPSYICRGSGNSIILHKQIGAQPGPTVVAPPLSGALLASTVQERIATGAKRGSTVRHPGSTVALPAQQWALHCGRCITVEASTGGATELARITTASPWFTPVLDILFGLPMFVPVVVNFLLAALRRQAFGME